MLNKKVLAVATGILCSLSVSTAFAEAEFKMINFLRYYKTMYNATPYTQLMQIPLGSGIENVGGIEQDTKNLSRGLPMAFRPTKKPNEVWVLDSINESLKLFKSGRINRRINLNKMGFIQDFAINNEGNMAFLNRMTGNIFVTDNKGNILKTIPGFQDANSIEFKSNKELLVVSPLSKGVVSVSTEGPVLAVYEADQSLSNFSSEKGIWGLDCFGGTLAKLYVRSTDFSFDNPVKVIAEFPLKGAYEGVEYKGGNIYGFDEEGNIYFGLIACDLDGIIYRDRIYKCDQNGKVLKEMDVIDNGVLSPDLPRHRIACPDGKIMTFYSDEIKYYSLHLYTLK